ncbi:MAG: GAF domain-containing protein [Anaerolineae bacterium]|nr:GAF domain-containing protein [Anaerolineae bacterium]
MAKDASTTDRDATLIALLSAMEDVERELKQSPVMPAAELEAHIREWRQLVLTVARQSSWEPGWQLILNNIRLLNSSLDLRETLHIAISSLFEITQAEHCCLMLFDDEGHIEVEVACSRHSGHIDAAELEFSHTVVQDVMKSGQAVLTTNAQLDPRFAGHDSVVGYQLRSILCIPLRVRNRVMGALYLDNRVRNGAFSTSDLMLLTAFANQAAIAIENARLFEAERKQRELAEALGKAAAIVNSTLDLDQVLDHILEQVARVVPGDNFNIMLLENGVARTVRWRGYRAEPERTHIANLRMPVADFPYLQEMVRTGKPVIVPHTLADPRWVPAEGCEWRLSYVAAPLRIAERVVGFLNVTGIRPGQFSAADAERLEVFSHYAATAIENARLYQELRHRASELASTVSRLKELDRLKNEFLQTVSHELRTPVAVIEGYMSLFESGELGELRPEQQEAVTVIHRRVKTLSNLVQDVTLILEIQSRSFQSEPFFLEMLIQAVVNEYAPIAEGAGLKLSLEMPPFLTRAAGSTYYLRRAFEHLLDNAVKFTPAGGSIKVRLSRQGRWAQVQVSDTGIGIAPEQQARIFERFYQVDGSATRRYGGIGLGLAVVREVVEAHGGTLTVTSEVGKGSTFTVSLPVLEE